MIQCFKKVGKDKFLKEVTDYSKDSWVNVIDPNEKEIDSLVKELDLNRDLIKDGLDPYENPRLEEEDNNLYIFLREPNADNLQGGKATVEPTNSFLFIVAPKTIITISKTDSGIFKQLSTSPQFYTDKKIRCLLMTLSLVSTNFGNTVKRILRLVKSGKTNLSKLSEKDIETLVLQEDILNDYLSSFALLINVHHQLSKIKTLKLLEGEREFIEDLVVDLNQTYNICKTVLRTITTMRDYYSATLTNSLNKTIRVLTVFTVFLTIPAVLSSFYGMNIALPFQGNPRIFDYLIFLVLGLWAFLFLVFKKRNIL